MGTVEGETPNGSKSREGHDYYWFQHGGKSILTHRFIAATTLAKWVPRDFDVDHINHNPSDNRPENLRIVTPRDNAGNRRAALLSELADLVAVSQALAERRSSIDSETEPDVGAESAVADDASGFSFGGSIPRPKYTGETKPAKHGGTWYKTDLGSWHLR
ncbi:MAG: HNH endonuclease signature motif containing protein [Pseudomonadota bacterium]|nr:HNH endonuclease signature motif containing protein [Pseudomonadota bacterium]